MIDEVETNLMMKYNAKDYFSSGQARIDVRSVLVIINTYQMKKDDQKICIKNQHQILKTKKKYLTTEEIYQILEGRRTTN